MTRNLYSVLKSTTGALAIAAALPSQAFAQASPSPYMSATRYDPVGRITGTIAPDPDGGGALAYAAVRNTYDTAGRLIRVETGQLASWQSDSVAPASWTGFTVFNRVETSYDAMGRKLRDVRSSIDWPTASTNTVNSVTQYHYDLAGRLDCTAVRMNPTAFPSIAGAGGSLPASACTLGTSGAYGADRITSTVYDAAGQRRQLREGVGSADEAAEVTYDYNGNGQIKTVIDGNGNRAELRYDGHGRQDRWTFPSATGPGAFNASTYQTALSTAGSANASDYEEYGYDGAGNRTSLRRRDGTVMGYQYDLLSRITVKVVPDRANLDSVHERDVYYDYDLRGLQTRARFDSLSGEGITNQFDGFGRLSTTTNNMGGTTRTLSFLYDGNGSRTRITHPDGTIFTSDYDGLNRLIQQREGTAGTILTNFSYNALRLLWTRSNLSAAAGASTMLYDGIGRLTSLGHDLNGSANDYSATFAYTPASQIQTSTRANDLYAYVGRFNGNYSYANNGRNELNNVNTGLVSVPVPSDANGNITGDGFQAYLYDIENRLVRTVVNSSGVTTTLTYDPLGRLFQIATPTATRQMLYDGDELVGQFGGATSDRYVHGVGTDDPVLWYEGTTRRFLHADRQGSVVATTYDSGLLVGSWPNRYDEYGAPMAAANQGRFQYTGQIWLPEVQAYYYKARIYSPNVGRFIQTDPVGYEGGINLYAYAGNDPVNRVDPDGQSDVNLTTRYDPGGVRYVGEHFDMPGVVTVFGHGSERSVGFRRESGYGSVSPRWLEHSINGRSLTQPVALLACQTGGRYAENLAARLGRPVIATRGWVRPSLASDGTITLTAIANRETGQESEFNVHGRGGWQNFGIDVPAGFHVRSFSYNNRTGAFSVRITGTVTGSRMQQTRTVEGTYGKDKIR